MTDVLNIQYGPIIWTILNFLILLLVLRAAAWKPILRALDARETAINDALNRAELARSEAERILAENQKSLRAAEEEGQRVLRDSRELAERLHADASQRAQEEGRRLVEQAQQEIERNKEKALLELRGEVASLAVGAAERILNENLDDDRQRRLVDDYLNQTATA